MSSQIITERYLDAQLILRRHSRLPNPEDGSTLKAILAHDALAHPDHPLHVEGVEGAQLYIGVLKTGEFKLLFSSAQVDYIRYWLHATGQTKDIIPLPYSDCLLTMSDLQSVATNNYPDGGAVRNAIKHLDKANKRIKTSSQINRMLGYRRDAFERVRGLWTAQTGVWCAIDFEASERYHKDLTEFGWRLVGWKDGAKVEDNGHLIVKGSPINTQYVPDFRNHYKFGQSETVPKAEFKKRIHDLILELQTYGPVFLVFHDDRQDVKYLKQLEVSVDNFQYMLPTDTPSQGIFVLDTAELLAGLMGEGGGNTRSLGKMCGLLGQNAIFLHNAGNDAYHTLGCLVEMAGNEPIDIQRERRFPGQTSHGGLWVKTKPGQEGSEDEDEDEGDSNGPKLGYDPATGKIYRLDVDMDDSDDDL